MLARRIMSHGPSTAKPPRCTIASASLVTRRMSAMRAMSPGMDFSPAASFFTGLMSESRRLYLPASSRRRYVPTSPAAPVMRMVFMASCSELLPGSDPDAPGRARYNDSADALLDQRNQCLDGFRRNHVGTGIDRETGKPVLLRQHALHHRQESLQVELLVERDRYPAFLQAVDRRRREVDPAHNNVARLLSRGLQRLRNHRGDAAVLRTDPFHCRVLCDVSRQHRYRQRAVGVHFSGNLEVIDFHSCLLQRVLQAFVGLTALGLAQKAVDQGLVAGLESCLEHLGCRYRTARIQFDAGIAGALRPVHHLDFGERRIPDRDQNAFVFSLLDQRFESIVARMAHDADAVRFGGKRLAKMFEHLFRLPRRILLNHLDAESV